MDPRPTHDVCIHGAGAVGRSLALALARQGLAVVLVEPAARTPAPDLRTYALNAASVAVLRSLKVWDALPGDAVTPVYDMRVHGDAPGATLGFSAWTQRVEALAWIVDAGALDAALASAVNFAPHVLRSERPLPAALQAHCEGREADVHQRLGVRFEPQAYGQRAIAARLSSDRPHAGTAWQWFRSPDVLALLPFDRPEAGRSYGLVWSLPAERADALMALDAPAFEAALQEATGDAAGTLRLQAARAAWSLGFALAEPVAGAGWVLLGDAAHRVHPLAGQGLNLGLADVAALAQVLAAREPWRSLGDARLLRRYARERAADTQAMGQLTDGLLHLFATREPWLKSLRNRGLGVVDRLTAVKRALAARALG
ncbi:FAD-dependent monooxygenase [Aquabacterium sp. J223]|uniref:FAD-dependent monooxygenase n=1 Tax=Aquabacterium sp. J223 TaxID=2898431 RepID=UPI0021AD72B5|nr:FAD-dependent monooxygenase [Aquabacterium sp. J223]UUX96757.1 FAD-dependent monooxygenase [Aquabacterium sp. J223]